jgi:hypothetical protein
LTLRKWLGEKIKEIKMKMKIIPKSQRAKNSVREHGEIMEVEIGNSIFQGKEAHLLKSIKPNDDWWGWLTVDDADFEIVHTNKK